MPKRSYEKIKASFEVEPLDYDNYTDITHKFNDIYDIDFNDVSTLQEVIRGGENLANKSSSEIESNFSLSLFLVALNEKKIKKGLITTSFVELLKSMASLYKLDESELCEILSTSIEGVGNKAMINFDTFRSKCYSYKKIPTMDTKETKRFTDKRIDFDAMGVNIDRKHKLIKECPLPDIFTEVPSEEYDLLAPLAARAFVVEDMKTLRFMSPTKYDNDAAFDEYFSSCNCLNTGSTISETVLKSHSFATFSIAFMVDCKFSLVSKCIFKSLNLSIFPSRFFNNR